MADPMQRDDILQQLERLADIIEATPPQVVAALYDLAAEVRALRARAECAEIDRDALRASVEGLRRDAERWQAFRVDCTCGAAKVHTAVRGDPGASGSGEGASGEGLR